MRRTPFVVLAIACVLVSANASADERAEELYVQGKQLAQEHRYEEACAKFEESQKLEPAIGTQFNLADCLEHTKKPASALRLFIEVARVARMSGKQDRQRAAEERVAALDKTVPRLRIKVTGNTPGMTITRNGEPLPQSLVDQADPVDLGKIVVHASASGYLPFEQKIEVAKAGETTDVVIPALELVPTASSPPPPAPPVHSTLSYVGLGVGAVGVIGMGVGAVFFIDALGKKDDAACDGTDCRARTAASAETLRDAQSSGNVATIFVAIGATLAVGGAAMWFFLPKVSPSISANSASIGYRTTW